MAKIECFNDPNYQPKEKVTTYKKYLIVYYFVNSDGDRGIGNHIFNTDTDIYTEKTLAKVKRSIEDALSSEYVFAIPKVCNIINIIPLND